MVRRPKGDVYRPRMDGPMIVWRAATGQDVPHLVNLTQQQFEHEADEIFRTDPVVYTHNLMRAVVDQFYAPASCLVKVARIDDRIAGYVWVERGQHAVWAADEMAAVKIVHVDMALSTRQRLRLCSEMIDHWEAWALVVGIPVICSTTMRGDQAGFLKLHERRGYDVRGSIAYKRLTAGFPGSSVASTTVG